MLDPVLGKAFSSLTATASQKFSQGGITASASLIAGTLLGLIACLCVGLGEYLVALALLLIARFVMAVSNASARQSGDWARHHVLATCTDYLIFGAFVFFFCMSASNHGLAATLLVFAFMLMGMAYLAYLKLAARKGESMDAGYGFVGQTEMLIFMSAVCLYPAGFSFFAAFFALMCFGTAAFRMAKAVRL